jgi:hypothetical protein
LHHTTPLSLLLLLNRSCGRTTQPSSSLLSLLLLKRAMPPLLQLLEPPLLLLGVTSGLLLRWGARAATASLLWAGRSIGDLVIASPTAWAPSSSQIFWISLPGQVQGSGTGAAFTS